ncbi:MAG: sigma-54-dependent Fis family transcriptional regulator [Myxococcales bacterium]|nr:sigma-54-dependent Fis family transcriptional regulator [Myxococcales bacterium]
MSEPPRVLDGPVAVVEDDPTTRHMLAHWLASAGYRVVEHAGGASLLEDRSEPPAIACVDLGLGDIPGLDVLKHLHARDPELPVIIVTAQRELETAIEAMRAGAYDYVAKPLDRNALLGSIARAAERRILSSSVRRLESELAETRVLSTIVGESAPMRRLAEQVARVLDNDVSVCICGESGTGKELVARAIHSGGARRRGPFVAVNCGAIPESLQESELFGHERGSFTGATATHRGRLEQANGGTLFLDELAEMSLSTQASLLRAIQERCVRRVGGTSDVPIDTRVVCATHKDLRKEVEAGRFREDLYYRLVVFPIELAPLRERRDDVPLLVGHFLRSLANDLGRDVPRVEPGALEALAAYRWPGNVRELMNVMQRTLLSSDGGEIQLAHLPREIRDQDLPKLERATETEPFADVLDLHELERLAIRRALERTGGSVTRAAKLLGIGRATIYRKIAAHGLTGTNG